MTRFQKLLFSFAKLARIRFAVQAHRILWPTCCLAAAVVAIAGYHQIQTKKTKISGVIVSGLVLDAPGGKPAAGATVEMWDNYGGISKKSIKTDANGKYTLTDIPPSIYTIRYVPPAGVWCDDQNIRVGVQPVRVDDFFTTMPQFISGTIRDAKTKIPVPGVQINISTPQNRAIVETDENGKYCLYVQPRDVELQCTGTEKRYFPDDKNGLPSSQQIRVKKGAAVRDVDFLVRSAPKLSGRILGADGKPARNVNVNLRATWTAPPGALIMISSREYGPTACRCRTDSAGRFHCYLRRRHNNPLKNHAIELDVFARAADLSAAVSVAYTLTNDEKAKHLGDIRLSSTVQLELNVVDEKNQPIDKAKPLLNQYEIRGTNYSGWSPLEFTPQFKALGKGRFRAIGLHAGAKLVFSADARGYRATNTVTVIAHNRLKAKTIRMKRWDRLVIPDLLKQLKSANQYKREHACRELAAFDGKQVIDALRERLRNDRLNTVRYSAAEALGKIGPKAKSAVPDLMNAVRADSSGVDREAAKALGLIGDIAAVDAIGELLDKPEYDARLAAIQSLGILAPKAPKALKYLAKGLNDSHANVRRAAAEALGTGGKAAIPLLTKVLFIKKSYCQAEAALALGKIGDRSALPALHKAMREGNGSTFRAAALAIRQIEAARSAAKD